MDIKNIKAHVLPEANSGFTLEVHNTTISSGNVERVGKS